MIVKSFEIKKIKDKPKFFLFYGENQGFKNQLIDDEFKKKNLENCYFYEENEILNNKETFFSNLLTKSFFENEKLIIINRATDKIKELVEEIVEKNPEEVILIVNGGILEKKSKLRSFFEKNELQIILDLYAKMVSEGSWKDYGLNISNRQVSFSVFKNAAENALYKICKNFKPSNKNLKYLITDSNGKVLKNSFELEILLKNTNWKNLKK